MIAIKMQLERLAYAKDCLSDLSLIPNEIEDTVIAAKAGAAIKQINLVERFLNNFSEAVTHPEVINDFLNRIKQFDIEKFIRELHWADSTPDIHKTLVGGNLRNLFTKIKEFAGE